MLHGPQSSAVFLVVYDIIPHNAILSEIGIGVHHSGIEVYGKEVSFGRCAFGTGVFTCAPCHCPKHSFRERFLLGRTHLSSDEVDKLIGALAASETWTGQAYHLLQRNCNNFTEQLAEVLVTPERRLIDDDEWGALVYKGAGYTVDERTRRRIRNLVPWWVNKLARFGLWVLPAKYVEKLEAADRAAQGVPPLATC